MVYVYDLELKEVGLFYTQPTYHYVGHKDKLAVITYTESTVYNAKGKVLWTGSGGNHGVFSPCGEYLVTNSSLDECTVSSREGSYHLPCVGVYLHWDEHWGLVNNNNLPIPSWVTLGFTPNGNIVTHSGRIINFNGDEVFRIVEPIAFVHKDCVALRFENSIRIYTYNELILRHLNITSDVNPDCPLLILADFLEERGSGLGPYNLVEDSQRLRNLLELYENAKPR